MLKGFGNILVKEIKELIRDPKILLGMIIVPLIMFPILGGIMNFSMESAKEKAEKASVLVLNKDGGYYSELFIGNLSYYVKVINVTATNVTDIVGKLSDYNTTELIEIPADFSEKMAERVAVSYTHLTLPTTPYV